MLLAGAHYIRPAPVEVALVATVRHNGLMPPASVHGHALLNYLIDQGGPVNLETLRKWAQEAHGLQARYHTCSAHDLTFEGILGFLQERTKVVFQDGAVSAAVTHVCSHDDDHPHVADDGHH